MKKIQFDAKMIEKDAPDAPGVFCLYDFEHHREQATGIYSAKQSIREELLSLVSRGEFHPTTHWSFCKSEGVHEPLVLLQIDLERFKRAHGGRLPRNHQSERDKG